jgi:phage baseplate assembly protein W
VTGTKNLIQALKNRIATVAGTYVYHKEYGSHIPYYIGKKNKPQWINLVKADVKQVCLRDPRISQLKAFKLFAEGDVISISFDAIPISSNSSLKVNLIV